MLPGAAVGPHLCCVSCWPLDVLVLSTMLVHAIPACLKVHNDVSMFSRICTFICADASLVCSAKLQINAFV